MIAINSSAYFQDNILAITSHINQKRHDNIPQCTMQSFISVDFEMVTLKSFTRALDPIPTTFQKSAESFKIMNHWLDSTSGGWKECSAASGDWASGKEPETWKPTGFPSAVMSGDSWRLRIQSRNTMNTSQELDRRRLRNKRRLNFGEATICSGTGTDRPADGWGND